MLSITLAFVLTPLQAGTAAEQEPQTPWELLSSKYDTNGDGQITAEEYSRGEERFARLDLDGDGVLTRADAENIGRRGMRRPGGSRVGGEARVRPTPPPVGKAAPDFDLPVLHWGDAAKDDDEMPKTVKLSSFAGEKPVALIFGSYT